MRHLASYAGSDKEQGKRISESHFICIIDLLYIMQTNVFMKENDSDLYDLKFKSKSFRSCIYRSIIHQTNVFMKEKDSD